jgi:16S rRNA (guanine527-N7)-methyltransferase
MRDAAAPAVPVTAEEFAKLLTRASSKLSIPLSPSGRASLARFLAELDLWRGKVNLTGRLSAEDLAIHALESVAAASLIARGARVVDIGSGGGFPAIPIAAVRPDVAMTMVEPRRRKAAFLRHAARTLGLESARVIEVTVESISAGPFSVATSRALGELAGRLGRAPFLEPDGLLLAWTSDPDGLAAGLSGAFRLESVLPLPGAQRRAVAAFRRV